MKCEVCGKEIEKSKYYSCCVCSTECFTKAYWLDRIKHKNSKTQVVINGIVYQIEREDAVGMRGFDGSKYTIEFFDGRKVTTTNLWANGRIPDEFRNKLPDNARWGHNE